MDIVSILSEFDGKSESQNETLSHANQILDENQGIAEAGNALLS